MNVIDYSASFDGGSSVAKGIGKQFVAVYKEGRKYVAQFVNLYQECTNPNDEAYNCVSWCSGKIVYTSAEMREAGYKHRKGNAEVLLGA